MEHSESHPEPGAGAWSRRRWPFAAAALVLAAALALVWRHYAVRESTDDAQIDGHIVPIAARVGGAVVAVDVEDNQLVAAGAPLVTIDPKDYEVALDRAQADLAEAEASAHAARTGVPVASTTTASQLRAAESALASAEARLRSAEARLREAQARDAKASQDLERLKRLFEKDEVSREEYDGVVVGAEVARASREAAAAAVKEAEEGVSTARAHLDQAKTAPQQVAITKAQAASAEARVEQARASLAQARLDLEHTKVIAPVAGVVSRKTVQVGEIVQPGQPLLAIVPLDDVWVTANFKEGQLRDMKPGQPASISVDAYGGRRYRGHVDSIAPATGSRFSLLPPENATGNYVKVVQRVPVKIVFETGQDPEHLLRPGMSVVPTVFLK